MRRKAVAFFIFLSIFLIHCPNVIAQDFNTDYVVEYFPQEIGSGISTHVKLSSTITNLRSDIVVKKIALSFPKSFIIRNAVAADDKGAIEPEITRENNQNTVTIELGDPNIGRDSTNTFKLEFDQEKLFEINGNIWEVIIPTIDRDARRNYKVVLHLPRTTDKKISIAKPKPDDIRQNEIVWNNVTDKTIYAVIGDKQYYRLKLNYHLKNPKLVPVYTDVAFPPDTLYQKVYLTSLNALPSKTMTDEDGNFLARYILKPNQNLEISYEGLAEIDTKPRDDVRPVIAGMFENQKSYLLTAEKYWILDNAGIASDLKDSRAIYEYVTDKLRYNYEELNNKNLKRMGANKALQFPDKAVCMEFSDLFIALAREKGIYSREVEGYGFSHDQTIRPISLISDILHSWPEYYDTKASLWVPMDPTWENTSGIDYYSSFDLNHITFAIHGKRADYPWPAGMYKTENSKDVIVSAADRKPNEKIEINLDSPALPDNLIDEKVTESKVTIKNNGNIFLWNVAVEMKASGVLVSPDKIIVPMIAPMEKKEIGYQLAADKENRKKKASIDIFVMGNKLYRKNFTIVPYYYEYVMKGFIALSVIVVLLLIFKISLWQNKLKP